MDIGEVVGGSQRISNETELVDRMTQLEIDPKHLDWYVSLRRFGSVAHGGFGIGIERLVAVITGMTNVKDCISFPITVHHCTY
jgi:asparaginyl-tRNA synthetase